MTLQGSPVREPDPEIARLTDAMMAKLDQRLHLLEDESTDPDAFVRKATHEVMAKLDQRLHLLDPDEESEGRTFSAPASPSGVGITDSPAPLASTD